MSIFDSGDDTCNIVTCDEDAPEGEPYCDGHARDEEDEDEGPAKVLVAECPVPWCDVIEVAEDPLEETKAAQDIADHVNEDHSEMDRRCIPDTEEIDE